MATVTSLGVQTGKAAHKTLRAAAYARVSTTLEIQEHSLETQMDYFRRMISDNPNLTLVDVYGDQASGRDIHGRTNFIRMLDDCRKHKIDIIYTKSISRFGRDVADVLETLRELKTLGIQVIFEKEGLDSGDSRSELLFSILATIAQEESRSISTNLQWSRTESLKKGKPYTRPSYGYVMQKGTRIWRLNYREARRVKKMFEMASEGCKYKEIIDALDQMEEEEETGRHWNSSCIHRILENPNYTGSYVSDQYVTIIDPVKGKRTVKNTGQKGQYILEGHHEALVSKETFEKVQKILEEGGLNSRRPRSTANKSTTERKGESSCQQH